MTSLLFRKLQYLSLSLLMLTLTACGGSGSRSFDATTLPPAPVSSSSASSSSSVDATACIIPASEGNGGDANVAGFYVADGQLFDGKGNAFVMRGVNYPHAWFHTQRDTAEQLADIASTCANSVRIVLSNGTQTGWTRNDGPQVAEIIAAAKANNLVVMLEVHDSTGFPQNTQATDPQNAVDYWLSDDIRAAIDGEEGFVLINIANEPLGNFATTTEDRDQWVAFHTDAIEALRTAGLMHTLVVDAPNWGQDWSNSMRDGTAAQTVFDSDVNGNVVFSVHMYDVYGTTPGKEGRVEQYMQAFADKNLPLIVGEFAADHGAGVENDVDEAAIMAFAEHFGFGYLGWSWSGNSTDLSSLDIVVGFDVDSLSPWGETLINGANGIRATSHMCSCFLDD